MNRKHIVIGTTLPLLLLYAASYVALSITGGYVFTQSGKFRAGISLDDEWIWMPRLGWAQRYEWCDGRNTVRVSGLAGWAYLPLILVDQRWVHPTKRFLRDDGTWVVDFTPPPRDIWHPDILEQADAAKEDDR